MLLQASFPIALGFPVLFLDFWGATFLICMFVVFRGRGVSFCLQHQWGHNVARSMSQQKNMLNHTVAMYVVPSCLGDLVRFAAFLVLRGSMMTRFKDAPALNW